MYHYTDKLSLLEIFQDKSIKPFPTILHKDLFAQDKGFQTEPIVWLTINPILDGTVVAKMQSAGWETLTGNLCRISLPTDYCDVGLGNYVDKTGIDPDWFQLMVQTGLLVGSHYTTWRLFEKTIPAKDWVAVEILSNVREGETIWSQFKEGL